MRAKVLTLRFSPTLGRFDDAPLVSLQQKIVLEHVREHLVQVGEEAMLLCVATWREKVTTGEELKATKPQPAAAPESQAAANGTAEPHRTAAPPVDELRAAFTPDQQALFDLLRHWRRQKAHNEGVPGYVILTNRQLVEVVQHAPRLRPSPPNHPPPYLCKPWQFSKRLPEPQWHGSRSRVLGASGCIQPRG